MPKGETKRLVATEQILAGVETGATSDCIVGGGGTAAEEAGLIGLGAGLDTGIDGVPDVNASDCRPFRLAFEQPPPRSKRWIRSEE